jgi:hypothetical protein
MIELCWGIKEQESSSDHLAALTITTHIDWLLESVSWFKAAVDAGFVFPPVATSQPGLVSQ